MREQRRWRFLRPIRLIRSQSEAGLKPRRLKALAFGLIKY